MEALKKSTVMVDNMDLRSELKLQLVYVESGKHAKVHFRLVSADGEWTNSSGRATLRNADTNGTCERLEFHNHQVIS